MGFVSGYADVSIPLDPPDEMDANDGTAYSEGVQAGRQGAIDGLDIGRCISAGEPSPGEGFAHLITGAEILHGVYELVALAKIAAGVAGLVVALIEIGASARAVLPLNQTALPEAADPLLEAMDAYGVGSLEVFAGIGRDPLSHDCEIQLTGLYPSLDDARSAALAMERADWLIVSWRTDQCGSFRVVEAAPQQ
ncbi:hypothetical protein MELE44368_17595 [Mycolicibacterium elephantis DSM 44368]|uniref:Uncharacterized protein n=2 Tax=Mycolicibacterium elephantis TaxID=81858 RepID=A0A439DUI2_9MYCO|nr:hypothetical protein MELE44368_17595 [Mycolicibacterium elephantis DSM 44368]